MSQFFANANTAMTESVLRARVRRHPQIRVEGNTDNLGEESWNQGLSERRAGAIREYLTNHGIDGRRIVARGDGSSKPLASNSTAEGRARNRRTEILFIPAKS